MDIKKTRNFCIIAHIDHGKSTLADRMIEVSDMLEKKEITGQILDDMDIEQERGITIKSHPVQMDYKDGKGVNYSLNIIDTPGHVDFTYEVSRSMAACEGALLLIDSTQGVEAQTVSNTYLAIDSNLEIIPIINKIDMDNSDVADTEDQITELLGCDKDSILKISAKKGLGVSSVFNAIIERIPPPKDDNKNFLQALIFDSYFDQYRGVVIYVRVVNGYIEKNMNGGIVNENGCEKPPELPA